jgi:hypothetical protein
VKKIDFFSTEKNGDKWRKVALFSATVVAHTFFHQGLMLSELKKLALHSVALKKMAKYSVNWHFSALPQSLARFSLGILNKRGLFLQDVRLKVQRSKTTFEKKVRSTGRDGSSWRSLLCYVKIYYTIWHSLE